MIAVAFNPAMESKDVLRDSLSGPEWGFGLLSSPLSSGFSSKGTRIGRTISVISRSCCYLLVSKKSLVEFGVRKLGESTFRKDKEHVAVILSEKGS